MKKRLIINTCGDCGLFRSNRFMGRNVAIVGRCLRLATEVNPAIIHPECPLDDDTQELELENKKLKDAIQQITECWDAIKDKITFM